MSDHPGVWTAVVGGAALFSAGALSSFVTWLLGRRTGKAAELSSEAAMYQAMTVRFEKLTQQYDKRNANLEEQVARLESAVTQLTQVGRAFAQHVESLEACLSKAGVIDLPPRPVAAEWPPKDFQLLQGGKAET